MSRFNVYLPINELTQPLVNKISPAIEKAIAAAEAGHPGAIVCQIGLINGDQPFLKIAGLYVDSELAADIAATMDQQRTVDELRGPQSNSASPDADTLSAHH